MTQKLFRPLLLWICRALLFAMSLMIGSCAGEKKDDYVFPRHFLFGTSLVGFQTEMGCPTLLPAQCVDFKSDWYVYATSTATMQAKRAYLNGQDPAIVGPGHYELFESDFDLAANELQNDALALTIEWSRIFPQPTDDAQGFEQLYVIADKTAVDHYHAVLNALRQRGLKPIVSLSYNTLPIWLHDAVGCFQDLAQCQPKGWVDKERAKTEIVKYAGFVAREFGGGVDHWITLNDPFALVFNGYIWPNEARTNPPAVWMNMPGAETAFLGLVEANARMYEAIKENDNQDADGDGKNCETGISLRFSSCHPNNPDDPVDQQGAKNVCYLFTDALLNSLVLGQVDFNLDGIVEKVIQGKYVDFVGINYYNATYVVGTVNPFFPDFSPLTTFDPFSMDVTREGPRGLYQSIMNVKKLGLPMYIMENGRTDPMDDGRPTEYITRHLQWVYRAIRDGAEVKGYFYHTLFDSYEWNLGMNYKCGLYAVNIDDPQKQRTARQSVAGYASISSKKAIPPALLAQFPEQP